MKWLARIGILALLALPACAGEANERDGGPPADDGGMYVDAGPSPIARDCNSPAADRTACCVGSADPMCCGRSSDSIPLDPSLCGDGDFASCGLDPDLGEFGATPPTIMSGALVNGAGPTLGGVQLGGGLDPRGANTELRGTIEVPEVRCDDCIDVAGLAFLDRIPTGSERASIRFGLLVNGAIDLVQVVVSGEVVDTYTLPIGQNEFKIRTFIDGSLEADTPGHRFDLPPLALPERIYPVVLGRTVDPGPEGFVSTLSAVLETFACDAPAAIQRVEAPVYRADTATAVGRPAVLARGPSGDREVFFAGEGGIEVAAADATTGALDPPRVAVSAGVNDTLEDPWVLDATSGLQLYAVRRDATGAGVVVRGVAEPGTTTFGALDPVLDAAEIEGVEAIDGPSVLDLGGGELDMIVRATLDGASDALIRLVSDDDGLSWTLPSEALDAYDARIYTTSADPFAFDADELAEPAVVFAGGLYRLYYAGRRGTRWTIGLLVSPDLVDWYPAGAVLGPDDDGYDAIGVRGPAPFVQGSAVGLYYLATDGVSTTLGYAGPSGT